MPSQTTVIPGQRRRPARLGYERDGITGVRAFAKCCLAAGPGQVKSPVGCQLPAAVDLDAAVTGFLQVLVLEREVVPGNLVFHLEIVMRELDAVSACSPLDAQVGASAGFGAGWRCGEAAPGCPFVEHRIAEGGARLGEELPGVSRFPGHPKLGGRLLLGRLCRADDGRGKAAP